MDGAFITSALPLDDQQRLRVQILDATRNRVVQAIRDLGFEPRFCSVHPRITPIGVEAACSFEVDLPKAPPPPVWDRTIIKDEIARDEKKDLGEESAMLKHLGLDFKARK